MLYFDGFACIHEFINVVDAWINQHVVYCSFMGLLPLGFLLYVWRLNHFSTVLSMNARYLTTSTHYLLFT
jgi:hypothetical protein